MPPPADGPDELARLREQVATSFQTEARLYKTQVELDHQLRIFRRLHQLGLELASFSSAPQIAGQVASFATSALRYERALVWGQKPGALALELLAFEGYPGGPWRERLALSLPPDHPLLRALAGGGQLTLLGAEPRPELAPFAGEVDLADLLALPLLGADGGIRGVLLAGNSPEQRDNYVPVTNEMSASGLASLSAQAAAALESAASRTALEEEKNLLEVRVRERTRDLAEALTHVERLRNQEQVLHETQIQLAQAKRQALEQEIDLARRVQSSILPLQSDYRKGPVAIAGSLLSAEACSGDFWVHRRLQDERVLVAVGDVTGHGLGSAMLTELAYGALTALTRSGTRLVAGGILSELNGILELESSPVWMSMIVGLIDPDGTRSEWASAGHPPLLRKAADGRTAPVRIRGSPLGAKRDARFETVTIPSADATGLVCYSDGLLSAASAGGEQLGLKRVLEAFAAAPWEPRAAVDGIRGALASHLGPAPLEDDVTLLAVSLRGLP